MRNTTLFNHPGSPLNGILEAGTQKPRQLIIGIILVLALFAFEIFNFDTTRFALESLLGDVRFAGLAWATILAIAFCSIDFAGLARLFTPERGLDEPKEIWYLTGAWLLGATMNAVMTWWAVSLTLLNHELGNEVMSREELLKIVPIFVAALVWLTRILFIGSLTVAGERLLHSQDSEQRKVNRATTKRNQPPVRKNQQPIQASGSTANRNQKVDLGSPQRRNEVNPTRVRQRPPRPKPIRGSQTATNGVQAARREHKSYR
jgi:hypothetical protein